MDRVGQIIVPLVLAAEESSSPSITAAAWAAAVTAIGVVVALGVGTATVIQRWHADRREQRWSRLQWALDLSLEKDNEDMAELGLEVLTYMVRSRITNAEQAAFIALAADRILRFTATAGQPGAGGSASSSAPSPRITRAAARLMIATNEKRCLETPTRITELAQPLPE